MSGKYSSQDTLLLRLVMRAIDQAELTHEINNACASISANLTYIGLQARNLCGSPTEQTTIKETFEEFDEICEESGEAIRRVTRSLGKPKTEATDNHNEVDLEPVILRATACFSDYLPAYDFETKTQKLNVRVNYRAFVFCFTKLMMSCIDARIASNNPQKKRINLDVAQGENQAGPLSITPHLTPDETEIIQVALSSLEEIISGSNFSIQLHKSPEQVTIVFGFAA